MTDRELDHILAGEPEIQPSSAFVESVMKAVHREAQTPPPIGFPWLCVIPGIFACGLTLISALAVFFYDSHASIAAAPGMRLDLSAVKSVVQFAAGLFGRVEVLWVGIGLLVTLACIAFPLSLLRRPS
jgi:hypothetical protein